MARSKKKAGEPGTSAKKPVSEFFPELCRLNPRIHRLRFETYESVPGVWERIKGGLSAQELRLSRSAERLHRKTNIPRWDCFAQLAMRHRELPRAVIRTAIAHPSLPGQIFEVTRKQILSGELNRILKNVPLGQGLVASSMVEMRNSGIRHIPMIDFLSPISKHNQKTIETMLQLLGWKGILVHSGRSYHFYGTRLLDHAEWVRFMAQSLLFAPIVDSRYIAHRLMDLEGKLKILSKDRETPTIIGGLRQT